MNFGIPRKVLEQIPVDTKEWLLFLDVGGNWMERFTLWKFLELNP